jgi:hypothetical protein
MHICAVQEVLQSRKMNPNNPNVNLRSGARNLKYWPVTVAEQYKA